MSGDPREIAEYGHEDAPPRDGIGEDDHPIPRWFQLSFYATLVFAAVYVPYYTLSGWSSASQWAGEVARAEERSALAAFGPAYTDRNGNVYPGVTLYDAWASGPEIEMPDVDVLGVDGGGGDGFRPEPRDHLGHRLLVDIGDDELGVSSIEQLGKP